MLRRYLLGLQQGERQLSSAAHHAVDGRHRVAVQVACWVSEQSARGRRAEGVGAMVVKN
jgi:hypothetical protein